MINIAVNIHSLISDGKSRYTRTEEYKYLFIFIGANKTTRKQLLRCG
jgi:hypothetical protein